MPAITESESEDRIRFPRLNAEATCGAAGTINDHYIEIVDYVTVAAAWAREKLGGNLNKIQVITARGDSMEPTIENGDVMFVDTAVEAFEGDGLYLLWYIDGLKAKRLQSTVGGGLMIISDNSSYRTETVRGEDLNAVRIIGRIRGAWRLSQF
ncbi:S24 family peptidase [Neisseria sp.]